MANLESRILYFNYSSLHKSNVPRKIKIENRFVGLSASQTYCVMIHIPFILSEFRSQLSAIWITIESMLQIMQIIYSTSISENDLIRLKCLIETHLKSVVDKFHVKLIPKHHILLHYPTVIRAMGPVIYTWTMRM